MPESGPIATADSRESIRDYVQRCRARGERIALVPTMGNLHAGHLALVDRAREIADRVIASVYVNPTQFSPGEDFDNYPRTLHNDREALAARGCDIVFAPRTVDLYPFGLSEYTAVHPPSALADILCGAARPGHFDGVVSVVSRLFNIVQPDAAVFGEKDYQQLVIIHRMVEDLAFALSVESVATTRDNSGLAMSSRNNYLDADQRKRAAALYHTLCKLAERISAGERDFDSLQAKAMDDLRDVGLEPEYVEIRRSRDLRRPGRRDRELRVLGAAWCGPARLIDNVGLVI